MLTEEEARSLAAHWVQAWNSHDLDDIMSHYAEAVILVSPVASRVLNDPSGTVKGKHALRAYFKIRTRGLSKSQVRSFGSDVGTVQRCPLLREPKWQKDW